MDSEDFPSSTSSFSISRAFSDANALFLDRAGYYIAIAVLFMGPGEMAEIATRPDETLGAIIAPMLITILFGALAEGSITLGAFEQWKGIAFGRQLIRRGLAYFGAILVASLVITIGLTLGLILLVVPGLILWSLVFFAIPAIVEENLGGLAGIQRSFRMGTGNRLKIFFLSVLYLLILMGGEWVLGAVLSGGVGAVATWLFVGVAVAYGVVLEVAGYAQLRELQGNPLKVENSLRSQ